MKLILAFLFLIPVLACNQCVPIESAGPVTIRATKWGASGSSAIVMEYDNGYIKTLDRVCEAAVPVWTGMRANITFAWRDTLDQPNECFHVISVQRIY